MRTATLAVAAAAAAACPFPGNGAAAISGSFSDRCRDFAARSSKDISYVEPGTTRKTFACPVTNSPPAAVLEIQTPPLSSCVFNTSEYPSCLATDPRTVWSRPPERNLAFVFVFPFTPQSLTFRFRGTSSTDSDDDIASWSIDFGDGTAASGSWTTQPPAETVHVYAAPFFGPSFTTVSLTLTDAAGQRDTDTINLIGIDGSPD